VRIGGAPTKLDLAGVDQDGIPRDKLSDRDMVVVATMLSVPAILPKLEVLRFDDNDLGAAGTAAFAQAVGGGTSDALRSVSKLFLQRNHLGNVGLKQLTPSLRPDTLPNLAELHLAFNGIGDPGIERFAATIGAGALPKLSVLNLSKNAIGDAGAKAIAAAAAKPAAAAAADAKEAPPKPLSRLKWLLLGGNELGAAGAAALTATLSNAASMPNLEQLHLGGNPFVAEPSAGAAFEAAAKARPRPKHKTTTCVVDLS